MRKIKSLMVAMLLAMPVLSFAQVEATDADDEFDVSIDNKTTNTTPKVSNRNATQQPVKKTTTKTENVDVPVIEEVEAVIIDNPANAVNATPVQTVTTKAATAPTTTTATTNAFDDFENMTVPNEIVVPVQEDPVIEEVVTTTSPAPAVPVKTTPATPVAEAPANTVVPVVTNTVAPTLRNDRIDNIDDVTIPENMFALDSLLTLYSNQTYLTVDEECNFPNYNPQYDEEVYIQRLSKLPTIMEMPYNEVVRQMIDRYTVRNRRGVSAMLATQNLYMPIFEEALEAYGLPLELKYLPVIESGLNPTAVSRAGASGLWQFMPATAKKYGLEINSLVDERCDPIKSSYAAAKLLYDVYKVFGDWNLVIAAYNCGPGNVQKAIHRAGGVYDYWKIYPYLPKETRGYVPAFIAANYIMNYYCEHNICPMLSRLPEQTDTVMVDRDIRFETISKVLNIPIKQIQELNPQYRKDIINGNTKPSILRLPSQQIIAFVDNEDTIYKGSAPYKRTTVTPGYSGTDSSYTPVATTTAAPANKPLPAEPKPATTTASTESKTSGYRNSHSNSRSSSTATTAQPASETPSKYSRSTSSKTESKNDNSSSSKYTKKDSDKHSSHDSKKEPAKADASKGSKTDAGKNSKTDAGKNSKTDAGKNSKTDAGKNSKTDAGKNSKTDAGKNSKADAGKNSKADTSKGSKTPAKSDAGKGKDDQKSQAKKTPVKTSASNGTVTHTVKENETLSHIAARNGMTVTELKKKNPNIKGDMIRPGDKVRVK